MNLQFRIGMSALYGATLNNGTYAPIDVSGRFADNDEEEDVTSSSDSIKSVIFGGIDGILTSFGIISGAAGGNVNWNVTLILGFSAIFANGLACGCGEFLSSKAHRSFYISLHLTLVSALQICLHFILVGILWSRVFASNRGSLRIRKKWR